MTDDLDTLRAELAEFAQPAKSRHLNSEEARVLAGFEAIQQFVEEHGHPPRHGEGQDIFERLYAVRLDRISRNPRYVDLLSPMDHQGLLDAAEATPEAGAEVVDDDALMSELSEIVGPSDDSDAITSLKHVPPRALRNLPDEIANRQRCRDFDEFQPLLAQAQSDLKAGDLESRPFRDEPSIEIGDFFILSGQLVYVAEMGDFTTAPNGQTNARLRVIYDNGTESNLLLRSLERALYKDQTSRRLVGADAGPLFSSTSEEGDVLSGTIYVLRSKSDHPFVEGHRELIHKVGVTGRRVEARIADAANQATYLLSDVEIVATYSLVGIDRVKIERLLHQVLAPAQLDLTIKDRFGKPVKPREWFLVPFHVIEEIIERVRDGSITEVIYDPGSAQLVGCDS
jgi:hypothetical protein